MLLACRVGAEAVPCLPEPAPRENDLRHQSDQQAQSTDDRHHDHDRLGEVRQLSQVPTVTADLPRIELSATETPSAQPGGRARRPYGTVGADDA
jgi:hypothetical protein